MIDYAPFKCLKCGSLYCAWLPNKYDRDGCVTCGLCDECLKRG